jgi:hypothetical protein
MFKRRRRTERDQLLEDVEAVLKALRPLCGALLLGKRRGQHPGYEHWLDAAESALGLLEEVRESIERDQAWTHRER